MPKTPRTVILIRRALSGPGGAERVFRKYQEALSTTSSSECKLISISEDSFPLKPEAPSWSRAIDFTKLTDKVIEENPGALSISLERGPSAQVYRAGDGVHKHYRKLVGGLSLNPWHWVAPKLDEKSLRAAKIVIANSRMVARELRSYYPFCAEKVRVIQNGVDPKKFFVSDEPQEKIRERLGLPTKGTLFLFMGNGWRRKGLRQTLEIARRCKELKPTVVIVGKGKASELPRSGVIYKGVVDNMPDYYRACDAFILPTLYDPATSSVLESLACGTPVVTTLQNGAAELVQGDITGFLMLSQKKDIREASWWLKANLKPNRNLDRVKIAKTVEQYTVEREISEIRKILEELEAK